MNSTTAAVVSQRHDENLEAVIDETLLGVTDAHDLICNTNVDWLGELHELLPELPPPEAKFVALLLIANKAEQLYLRAFELLCEQSVNPELKDFLASLPDEQVIAPEIGEVRKGFAFLGGSPVNPNNWLELR